MGKRGGIIGLALLITLLHQGQAAFAGSVAGEFETVVPVGVEMETEAAEGGAQAAVVMNGSRRIEQVYLNLPEVYVFGEGFTREEVGAGEGYLSQDKLQLIDVGPFSETGEGIFYYVMLDISGSIPRSYFNPIKEGIQNLQNTLREKDQLVLCTFGETVNLAADGSQSPEQMAQILEGLSNRDQETLLFEGIDQVAALSDQTRGNFRRQIMIVVSDGEDFATGKKMAQEALNTLKDKGLPAYAFCIQDTAKENINSFGEFARTSGGLMETFSAAEGAGILTGLADRLQDDICVRYQASSNIVSNKEENFSFQFADDSVLSRAVMNVHWIPDYEAPYLEKGEPSGSKQLQLTFSEPVSGMSDSANYKVILEGQEIGVTGVAYDEENRAKITLSLAEEVKNGTYEVICMNLTDNSMEKNPLEGSISVEIRGIPEPEEPKTPKKESETNYAGILFLLVAAVLALIVVILVQSNKKKKQAKTDDSQNSQISQGNVSQVALQDQGFRGHVVMDQVPKKMLDVVISAKGRRPVRATWELGSSLIVGRASICDVTVEDLEMSRQHFCMEWDNGNIYVSDLGSTNGTSINGIRVQGKRRLDPGDFIEAGAMKFTIRW